MKAMRLHHLSHRGKSRVQVDQWAQERILLRRPAVVRLPADTAQDHRTPLHVRVGPITKGPLGPCRFEVPYVTAGDANRGIHRLREVTAYHGTDSLHQRDIFVM